MRLISWSSARRRRVEREPFASEAVFNTVDRFFEATEASVRRKAAQIEVVAPAPLHLHRRMPHDEIPGVVFTPFGTEPSDIVLRRVPVARDEFARDRCVVHDGLHDKQITV